DYNLGTAVHSFVDGDRSGDTDFHILKNGTELFGQFLPPRSGTAYSNSVTLAAGDRIDFAIGRGQDGILYGSGLKIGARLELMGGPPPPPPPPPEPRVFDLSRDFSVTSNPAGSWSYGWAGALDGSFNLLPVVASGPSQNGVIVTFWAKNTYEPAVVYINNSS